MVYEEFNATSIAFKTTEFSIICTIPQFETTALLYFIYVTTWDASIQIQISPTTNTGTTIPKQKIYYGGKSKCKVGNLTKNASGSL